MTGSVNIECKLGPAKNVWSVKIGAVISQGSSLSRQLSLYYHMEGRCSDNVLDPGHVLFIIFQVQVPGKILSPLVILSMEKTKVSKVISELTGKFCF